MIKKPISYYINKQKKNKLNKNLSNSFDNKEEKKEGNINNEQNKNNEQTFLEKIDKKLSKLSHQEKILYLKQKIYEIKSKNGNNSKLLFDTISKLISYQLISGDLSFNKGDYNLSLEKYKECLQLNEPLPGCEWSKYPEWFNQRILIFNSIASTYEKLNKKEQAIEYIKLSFNLEEKYNLKVEYNNSKYNGIIFLVGKQLILSGNYKEALKYLLKVEKNIYDEYNIEKIIKSEKIDENIDKNFIKDNPDEYIYLLNLIYKCFIRQKDYDLGEKYYQRYEEMYNILSKIKKIKYPFKGADENSDEEITYIEKIINNSNKDENIKLNFYKKINENFLINNGKMIDKAEDEFGINQKRNKSESKQRINTEKKNEDSINYNKEYINNYNNLSWGKEKEENKATKKIFNNNKSTINNNNIPLPLPKNKNKLIKKVNLSLIKDNARSSTNYIN